MGSFLENVFNNGQKQSIWSQIQQCVNQIFPNQEEDACYKINPAVGKFLKEQGHDVTLKRGNVLLSSTLLGDPRKATHWWLVVDGKIVDYANQVFNAEIQKYLDDESLPTEINLDTAGYDAKQLYKCLKKRVDV